MKVVSSGQKCPAGLSGRRPVSNPMGRISEALANTYSSIYLNELQMMKLCNLDRSICCREYTRTLFVGFHDRQCSSKRSELSSWVACWGRAGTSLAMLLLHLRTVASAEDATTRRGRWHRDLEMHGHQRNSREGERSITKERGEKPTENCNLLLWQRKQRSYISIALNPFRCWWGGRVPRLLVMSMSSAPATRVRGRHTY
ncbi:hypothetical protein B296_00021574 [Ensete ventricosum]|uniref:Uncharacterized protein n=1 Tax=Ensete ventricosum TaxID=4639 RepID=A0A427A711_ENSVE|nr:hypothetical protein B296_00021574 [Ensete ventricosum]